MMRVGKRVAGVMGVGALLGLLAPVAVAGQDRAGEGHVWRVRDGLVLDEDGLWYPSTPAFALRILRNLEGDRISDPATALLRQEFEPLPRAELDGLADSLVAMILGDESDSGDLRFEASFALVLSGWSADSLPGGTPYAGAFDALRRVYETLSSRVLADGGNDPIMELNRRAEEDDYWWGRLAQMRGALRDLFWVEPEGRGADYLLALIEHSKPPVPGEFSGTVDSVWCNAVHMLRENGHKESLPEIAREDNSFVSRCNRIGKWRITG